MGRVKTLAYGCLLSTFVIFSKPSRGDPFGGDVVVLAQILANAVQQLIQLRQILGNGSDTLGLLRDVNRGIREGLTTLQVLNPKFNPGIYGNTQTADKVLAIINVLYGRIPQTGEARMQRAQDQSVAESIAMNGALFKFADQADAESQRIFNHAQYVSPQGAGKLTAQSVAVLIGVTNQVLRTNSTMLKMMGQNMALQNKKEKIQAAQFKSQYEGLSSAFSELPKSPKLVPLPGGH